MEELLQVQDRGGQGESLDLKAGKGTWEEGEGRMEGGRGVPLTPCFS